MTQEEIDQRKLEIEQDKLKLAQDAFVLERRKVEETLQLERNKYVLQRETLNLEKRWSRRLSNPLVLAVLGALIGLAVNTYLQHRTARDNFTLEAVKARENFKLEAARIVMNSSDVDAARDRADALQKLFPDQLSRNFATALQPSKPVVPENPDLFGDAEPKQALIKLLAEHPRQREQIINDWSAVFASNWTKCLRTPNPCK
jgi:hypothetical protein